MNTRPLFLLGLCLVGTALFTICVSAAPLQSWATYLGGSGDDRLNDVTVAPDGDLLVCGNTTSTSLNGLIPTLIGADDPARLSMHGGFIAKISPDGQTIRWIRRFGRGIVFLTDVQSDGTSIYVTGVATSLAQSNLIAPFNGYDKNPPDVVNSEYQGFISAHTAPDTYRSILIQLNADATAVVNASWMGEPTPGRESYGVGDLIGSWYVASDIWRYMKQREEWAFPFMNPYVINRIQILENGDLVLLMDGGLRWAGGQDTLYRFAAGDISPTGLLWKTVFDAAGNNSTVDSPEHASVLSADMVVTPDEQYAYVTGGSNGWTGAEPYWNPYIFKFSVADGTQLWDRTGVNRGGPHGTYNIIQSLVGNNQADSYGQAVAVNAFGEPLLSMWADGGNTFLVGNPWTLTGFQGTAANQDGDGFFGFKARTFASVLGRYSTDGISGWLRSHRIRPNPNTNPDQNATMFLGIAPVGGFPDKAVAVGWTFGMPQIDPWNSSQGKGTIALVDLAATGTKREFVSRVPGVEEFMSVIRHPGQRTFTAVGYASPGAPAINALQATSAGEEDAYLITFSWEYPITENLVLSPETGNWRLDFEAMQAGTYQLEHSLDMGITDRWEAIPGASVSAASAGDALFIEIGPEWMPGFLRLVID